MLLAAVEALFDAGDAATRRRRYADAMGQLAAREPDDPDVASFYALALLGTMSRSLIGYVDSHEGHSQALAGSDTQAQVAARHRLATNLSFCWPVPRDVTWLRGQ